MVELPEAYVLSSQIEKTLTGKRILSVTANQSPHKFAGYSGNPDTYNGILAGRVYDKQSTDTPAG